MKINPKMFFALTLYILFSCNGSKTIGQKNTDSESIENRVKEATVYIEKDSVFKERLKEYYSDLGQCNELNFEINNKISPVSIKYFRRNQLIKTAFFQKYNLQDEIDFEKIKKDYDSINFFKEYELNIDDKQVNNSCKISLSFGKESNHLLPIRFRIVDDKVDSRIVYNPRTGYYLIEFNSRGNILNRYYIITSN